MIEFGLILGAGALALGIAVLLGFPLLTRATRLRLITSPHAPLAATTRSYLRIHDRSLLVLTALVAFAVFVGFGIVRELRPNDPASSPLALSAWVMAALVLGAVSSTGAIHLTAHALTRAATRFGDAAKASAPSAFMDGVRWAGSASLASVALIILCISALALALHGATALSPNPAPFQTVASLLPAFALGTVVSSIVAHAIGGVFVTASTALPHAPGRPSLVHLHLDVPVTRVADTLSSIATVLAATTAICSGAKSSASSLPLVPLVAGALGLLATGVGILVVRADATEVGARALDRGLWVTLALSAAIFAGLSHWLFGHDGWRLATASAVGLLGAVVMLWTDRWSTRGHRRSAQTTLARWGGNLERAALLGVVVAAVAAGGHFLGTEERAGVGMAFAVLGLLAPAPFLLAVAAFEAMARCHLKSVGDVAGACEQQLASSVDAGRGLRTHASASAIVAGWVACTAFAHRTLTDAPAWDPRAVLTVLCASFVGAVLVTWQIGASLRALAATRGVLLRLSSEAPTAQPLVLAPHVSASLQEAARQGIPSLVLLTTVPTMLWAALFWTTRPGVVAIATVGVVLGASLMGLLLSLGTSFPGESSHDFYRTPPACDKPVDVGDKWANNAPVSAPDEGDTLGRPLQSLVGPCIHASVKLLATAALALAALLF
jgi:K(+)-stimulated pyrophosphate-energized sodium pump